MVKFLILQVFSCFFSVLYASTLIPVSFKDQIHNSSGVVIGIVMSFEPGENSQVVTIRANKWSNASPKYGNLSINIPGGEKGGVVTVVEGAPRFYEGEKVVVMFNDIEGDLWINNLSQGKYLIKKFGKKEVVTNSVFPNHPQFGQLSLDDFENLLNSNKDTMLSMRLKNKYELQLEKTSINNDKIKRGIASLSKKENKSKLNHIWLLVILALLGGSFTISRKNST